MKIGIYARRAAAEKIERLDRLCSALEINGNSLYRVRSAEDLQDGTDMLLAIGGDGTFLSSAALVRESGVPVLGVNMGRLGFLSENAPEIIADTLASGSFEIEKRTLLEVRTDTGLDIWPYALNEVTVHRNSHAMLGVDVSLDGRPLPTYWADGLLIATASGSTAYSLSVGGPIVLPDSRVHIVSPIAPHNLNVRPMIVPDSAEISLSFRSRCSSVTLTVDNRSVQLPAGASVTVRMAQFSLNRVRLGDANFIDALRTKLFWGEDIRNNNE